ncbi:HD-GYP domain-containing protein [Roseateles sp. BYS87W]|uniref:HD-GYP domain-containing protein n=1 Tax=Pelomonas baiyunensis TaxID=3299026 RepID=A0ABW7H462_9BURK
MSDRLAVNQHYFDHLVETGQSRGIEATEDIVSGTGVKLVAKGAAIDARMRDRLLQHKLLKPLEACTRVVAGVATRPMDAIADRLMHEHALLASLCREEQAAAVLQGFRQLHLSPQLDTLLTVYADSGPDKLAHAVGVSLIAGALQFTLHPERPLGPALTAGLMHDVGELYIDPAILRAPAPLSPARWRQVVAHPVIAAGLLRDLPGGGPEVAEAVLHHHERRDGLGFPLGVEGTRMSGLAQAVAMAELMMETLEAGPRPGLQAAVRLRLLNSQFERPLLNWVGRCAKQAHGAPEPEPAPGLQPPPTPALLRPRIHQLSHHMAAQKEFQARWQARARTTAVADLLRRLERRLHRVNIAFASAGLGEDLQTLGLAPDELHEVSALVLELESRLAEIGYELHWRAGQLPAQDGEAMRQDFMASVPAPLAA